MNNYPNTWCVPPEARGPMQPHRLHWLKADPARHKWSGYMRQNACHRDLKGIFEGLLPCYCYATKANSRKIRSRVSQLASVGKGANMSELQAYNCMLPKQ